MIGVLDVVLHVTVVPQRIDEPAVIGVSAKRSTLEPEVALTEAEDAVVGRRRARRGLGFSVGPEGGFPLGYWISIVHRLRIAVRERPEVSVRAFADDQAVNGHRGIAIGLTRNRNQVGAGFREVKSEVGGLGNLTRARER